jgi:hypothetical protein
VHATISRVDFSDWNIDSEWEGQHTSLRAQVGSYLYDYSDVTLEVYSVNGKVTFH